MADAEGIMLVMQNSRPGQEDEHLGWYLRHHLPDVAGVPGMIRGELTRLAETKGGERWGKAACYWTSVDPASVIAETMRRSASGDWDLSGAAAIDRDTLAMMTGEALTGRVRSATTPDAEGQDRLLYIVLTNCTAGDDDAFNDWYSNRHLTDVVDVPGFVAAQRFRMIDQPGMPPCPYRYLSIYEVLAKDADAAFAELAARAGTDRMVISPTLDKTDVHAHSFAVLGTHAA